MQASNVSMIEQRAKELDEARRIRMLKSEEIDVEKYLHNNDITQRVRVADEFLKELLEEIENPKIESICSMPWQKTITSFNFRPGEVTLYAGGNGGGKSLITGQIALGLIKQNQSICIASFEMKPKRTLYRMMRQFSGEDIDMPRLTGKATYVNQIMGRFKSFVIDKLWMYDQQGTVNSKQVIAMARYCAMELGVQHVFIDSLMKCVSGEDDYNAQKSFVDELTSLARDHNIHIHLIHHIRKLTNEEMMPNKNDIKGTGAIADQVDNVLLMWRNKKKEHDAQNGKSVDDKTPDAMLMCEKQRNGEAEDWFSLWYHRESQQFVETNGGVAMAFDDKGKF